MTAVTIEDQNIWMIQITSFNFQIREMNVQGLEHQESYVCKGEISKDVKDQV